MHNLKWIAVPVAALGLVFLFFGMISQGAVQLSVAIALFAIAASIERSHTTTGTWPSPRPSHADPRHRRLPWGGDWFGNERYPGG